MDLSGPHEPTPRPGNNVTRHPAHYFLVLTVRPDLTADMCDAAVQTTAEQTTEVVPATENQVEGSPSSNTGVHKPQAALLYVALLGTKDDAEEEIKKLLAQINNDHANYPTELIFRLHSDKGGEFMSEKFKKWCADQGIHKTTTAGYERSQQ